MTSAALKLARAPMDEALMEGEFPFTRADFHTIRTLLHADSGIHLPDAKAALVYSRLAKRLRRLGLRSFAEYCGLVQAPEGREERRSMLTALTTNVTRFFREPHHFDHLRRLAAIWAPEVRAGGRLRLWSAGCSSGQEPYSIAFTLLSVIPEAAELDVRILATDIDSQMVLEGRAGLYSDEAVEPVPPEVRRDRLEREDAQWRVGEKARRLVVFNELNLMDPWPMKGRFQAIFCRNVAIYFETAVQDRLWERMADVLTPEGRLYVGHSERVDSRRLTGDGLTVYRLKEHRA